MAELQLRTCRLDDAGIPDLSDLIDITIDTAHIERVTVTIRTNDADPEQVWFYPLAELTLARHSGPVFVPLEATTRVEEAEHSAALLRQAFTAAG